MTMSVQLKMIICTEQTEGEAAGTLPYCRKKRNKFKFCKDDMSDVEYLKSLAQQPQTSLI